MLKRDLHTHTKYGDGENTPEEMVLAAIKKGMSCIGFSEHAYTPFDTSYCMTPETAAVYRDEVGALKEKYKGRIHILCGVEQDIYSPEPVDGYDYVIGAVHFILKDGEYVPVDLSADILRDAAARLYGGDMYALVEDYYKEVATIDDADIIAHLDLITKFNEKERLFDEKNERYIRASRAAADALLKLGVPFEINTGAMSRGYRSTPYPSRPLERYIKNHGGEFVFSSDAHNTEGLMYQFERLRV